MFARRLKEPPTALILVQVAASLALLLLMVHLFVDQINHISRIFEINALVLSLIITPIATELPEKFNSVVWIRGGKDNLAMGNITGAMVFQSCIPTSIGLIFTPWELSLQGLLSAGLCLLASAIIYFAAARKWHRRLPQVLFVAGGGAYLIFLLYTIVIMARG
jgi:cation:H+ antiporter